METAARIIYKTVPHFSGMKSKMFGFCFILQCFFYKFLIFVCDNVNANLANMGTGYLTSPFWRYRWDIYTSQLHSVLDWRCSDVVQACLFVAKFDFWFWSWPWFVRVFVRLEYYVIAGFLQNVPEKNFLKWIKRPCIWRQYGQWQSGTLFETQHTNSDWRRDHHWKFFTGGS